MDFYNSRYFRINKMLLKMFGLWPYQNAIIKKAIKFTLSIVFVSFVIPQIICMRKYSGVNVDRLLQAIGTIMYILAIFLKLLTAIFAEGKMKIAYENIVENWKLLKNQTERNTLMHHSEIGRYLTIGYMSLIFSALVIFITMPLVPVVIDHVTPINGSRIRIFTLEGEYGVDRLENYGKIYVLEAITCIVTTVTFVALDTTYAVCVEQCVGLMAVVKLRLKLVTKRLGIIDKSMKEDNTSYLAMIECIKLHKNAIHFVDVLEASYSTSFLVIFGTNVIILSLAAVVILMNLNQPMQLIRFLMIITGLFVHMFYLSWPGQKLIDVSSEIYENTYTNEWYECSLKTQKLLNFMMLRAQEPCVLTAGGLLVVNFPNFGSLTKKSISYITVFSSLR